MGVQLKMHVLYTTKASESPSQSAPGLFTTGVVSPVPATIITNNDNIHTIHRKQ